MLKTPSPMQAQAKFVYCVYVYFDNQNIIANSVLNIGYWKN